jgi:fumarate reductase subunit C
MTTESGYTLYHPKWYRHPVSVWWWLSSWRYMKFVLRELTSVPVAIFSLLTLWQVRSLANGPEAYARFETWMSSPLAVSLNVLIFVAVLFHTQTWFLAAPKAMEVRLSGNRLPDILIVVSNYIGWGVVSAVVAWFWLGR